MVCCLLCDNGCNLSVMEIKDRKSMDFITGEVIAIEKPYRWTSFDVVKRLRGAIQKRLCLKKFKVGHAGTLDPLATGVLLICTGRATKKIDTLQEGEKEYIATVKFGSTTPSYDLETEIDQEYPYAHITDEEIERVIPDFTGKIMQVPPVYSAVKVDGKRAYKSARKGKEIELKAKPLVIKELELVSFSSPEAIFRIVCSKGTYIRALARDLGAALGSGAHLTDLKRTRVGSFSLADCLSVEEGLKLINDCELSFPKEIEENRGSKD